jgi:hypothetical protein
MKFTLTLALACFAFVSSVIAADVPKELVDAYLHVQSALAADRVDGVGVQAKAIETAATALGKDADRIAAGAKKLQAATEIAAARTAFGELSEALVGYVEKTKSDLGTDVRVAFCPMANKPWLQKEKEIKNPYYGASMISCGSFRTKN